MKVNIPYRGSPSPLHLLVDSTGIKVEGEGKWNARKHGGTKRRVWRKIHIGIDEQTLEIRAAELTTSNVGDAPMLPELLDQIPPDQEIASVTADGAFDTHKCHDAIAARGAAAIIPPRKNAKPWKPYSAGAVARNEALRASRRFGRTIWRRWSGYHRRSRVETKMHCVKLLSERVRSRDFYRRVAEPQIRAAILNRFTALGTPITRRVGWCSQEKRRPYPLWAAAHGVMIVTPVNWYQPTSPVKLTMDRLVCADGGNPDPTLTDGDASLTKKIELAGWHYPRHLAGRAFSVVVHGGVAGVENVRRSLSDWIKFMKLIPAGQNAGVDRYIGRWQPYATSQAVLDADKEIQDEIRNAARVLAEGLPKTARGA